MTPLVTKKYIFERKLANKPIVVMLLLPEQRKRFPATRKLLFDTGVYKRIEDDNHGRNCVLTNDIHYVVPRDSDAYVNVIEKGHAWYNDVWDDSEEQHFLP